MQLEGTSRRLPIYLVIDVSSSMSGAPIEAANTGLRDLEAALRADPHALETAYVSIITFESTAQQIYPLTEAGLFKAPAMAASGGTALGAALRKLGECFDKDLRPKAADHPGDWKPLVFLLTDGEPTDKDWRAEAEQFKKRQTSLPANLIAVACGPQANVSVLKELTEMVVLMQDIGPESFRKLFQWVSQSVKVASKAAGQPAAAGPQLPTPPPGFTIAL
jgi:uncharacterized protein YegL